MPTTSLEWNESPFGTHEDYRGEYLYLTAYASRRNNDDPSAGYIWTVFFYGTTVGEGSAETIWDARCAARDCAYNMVFQIGDLVREHFSVTRKGVR